MQKSIKIKIEEKPSREPEKKPYTTPRLIRQGRIEEMTNQSVPPGPSQVESDRNIKENFAPVDAAAVLEKLAQIHLSTWNYKNDSSSVRHIGPMAQDFARAFGLGDSDRVIHTVDSGGVTMAAIQALYQLALEQNHRIAALETQVSELREAAMAV